MSNLAGTPPAITPPGGPTTDLGRLRARLPAPRGNRNLAAHVMSMYPPEMLAQMSNTNLAAATRMPALPPEILAIPMLPERAPSHSRRRGRRSVSRKRKGHGPRRPNRQHGGRSRRRSSRRV